MKIFRVIVLLVFIVSCKPNSQEQIANLNGYWEIEEVLKDGKQLKSYPFSNALDYFEVDSTMNGFRKKVIPNLEGKYIITQHRSNFKLSEDGHRLTITYDNDGVTYDEHIEAVAAEALIITNADGFVYIYKRYQPLDLSDE